MLAVTSCYAVSDEIEKGPTITPVSSGVVITSKEEVRRVKAWSKVFVTLAQPLAPGPEFLAVLDWVEEHVHYQFRKRDSRSQKLGELLIYRTKTLRSLLHTSRRSKRSPFDFVGDIGSSLFGIARKSDVIAIARTEQKLAGALEGVVEHQQQVLARVNLIGRRQSEISKKINSLIEYNEEQGRLIKTYWDRTQSRLGDHEVVQRISEVLSILEQEIYAYQKTFEDGRRIRTLCETGIVNEDLLPIEIVKQIQTLRNNHHLIPIHQYYQYIEVTVMTVMNYELICVLHAPILNEEKFIQYSISTFPIRKDQSYVRLYHDEKVIYGTYGGEIFFPRRCRGRDPIVCEAGVIYDKLQQPCLHGMITGDLDQLRQCPITLSKTAGPAHRIRASVRNRYVVSTPDVDYHYRCAGSSPMQGHLAYGAYIIDIGPTCNFDASIWSLRGIPEDVFYYNVTLVKPDVIQPALYLIQNVSKEWDKIELPPGIDELEFPNVTALHQVPHKSLVPETNDLIERLYSTPWWQYASGLCGIIMLIGFFYITYLCRGRIRKYVNRICVANLDRHDQSVVEDHGSRDGVKDENESKTEVKILPDPENTESNIEPVLTENCTRVPLPSQPESTTREYGTQMPRASNRCHK